MSDDGTLYWWCKESKKWLNEFNSAEIYHNDIVQIVGDIMIKWCIEEKQYFKTIGDRDFFKW
jgi:hypothetical protein